MKLEKTRSIIEHFKEIILKIEKSDPNYFTFLNYVTEYIVVIFYAEIEGYVKTIIQDKLRSAGLSDEGVSFMEKNLRHNYNNQVQIIVEDFKGKTEKEKFEKLKHFQEFKNLIDMRHYIAHHRKAARSPKTWEEIQGIAEIGEDILKNLAHIIS